ncbi:hypothetical protein D3C72_1822940 [compost metagenome]
MGTSGSTGRRSEVVTARALILFSFTSGKDVEMTSTMSCVSLAISELSAGALPLKGICATSMPVRDFKSSVASCKGFPMPTEA